MPQHPAFLRPWIPESEETEAQDKSETHLVLRNERLTNETLPKFIETLTHLSLKQNQIQVFPEQILRLQALQRLSLAENRLHSVPTEIINLPCLISLSLANNRLSTLPPLPITLHNLYIHDNTLSSLPANIPYMQNLVMLDANNNLVSSIGELPPSLCVVDLSRNRLMNVAEDLSDLPLLTILRMNSNRLTRMPNLQRSNAIHQVHLHTNEISTIPDWFWHLEGLRHLNVSSNPIKSLGQTRELAQLHNLNISGTHIDILPNMAHFPNLNSLGLAHLPIKILPQGLGHLKNLAKLDLRMTIIQYLPCDFRHIRKYLLLQVSPENIGALMEREGLVSEWQVPSLFQLTVRSWSASSKEPDQAPLAWIVNKLSVKQCDHCKRRTYGYHNHIIEKHSFTISGPNRERATREFPTLWILCSPQCAKLRLAMNGRPQVEPN